MDGVSGDVNFASTIAGLGFPAISFILICLLALLFSSYVKIVTVLGIVRFGLGMNTLPGIIITSGLAFGLSFLVMFPTLTEVTASMDKVLDSRGGVSSDDTRAAALDQAFQVWKKFLRKQTREQEIAAFSNVATELDKKDGRQRVAASGSEDPGWRILAPAFLVSQLRGGFETGLSLLLPLLVIDLLVTALIAAVGFVQLNPLIVSFPLKLLAFVALDGWTLITTNLVSSFSS